MLVSLDVFVHLKYQRRSKRNPISQANSTLIDEKGVECVINTLKAGEIH